MTDESGVETGSGRLDDAQNGAYVPNSTMLNVGLQQHSLQFAAFTLLRSFDEMKGEFQSRSRGQPVSSEENKWRA